MHGIDFIAVLSRWLHIGSVIVLVGGTVFMRYVLMPASEPLEPAEHEKLRDRIMNRWKALVHGLIAILVLTGIYNIINRFQTGKPVVTYHILLTVKILLALFILFVASALVGRSKGLQPLRDNRKRWLTINIAIAAIVLLISNLLRFLPNQ